MTTGLKVNDAMYQEITRLRQEEHLGAETIGKRLHLSKATVQKYVAKLEAQATNGQAPTVPEVPTEDVPLAWISLNTDTQGRARLNPAVIREYAALMEGGTVFPPIVLYFNGDQTFSIGDGYHRCHAARQAGRDTIQAEVREGYPREALLYACSANTTHGLRRTTTDKAKAVQTSS
jgi:hypothetical protein